MRLHKLLFAMSLLLLSALPAAAKDPPRSFSLSTSRTFAPGESVKIQLMARNVPELEFRVYKVRDAQKFFAGLKDLHSFGEESYAPAEQVDQETLIERIHDFKAHLWWLVRHFFRGQFTDDARDTFREEQGKLGHRSRVVGAAQFAQIPILNPSQLVARWRLVMPPVIVSETQQLPINGLAAGVYLIEATDGTYKAYTVAIVTGMAMVERTQNGQAFLYVADRKSGAPVTGASVALWASGKQQSAGQTDANGMATLGLSDSLVQLGGTPDNVWALARHGTDAALVTPWGYGFGPSDQQPEHAYIYTDRPVYRPGHTVHIKAVVRVDKGDTLALPQAGTPTLEVTDSANKVVFSKAIPLGAHGTLAADLVLDADAALGYYNVSLHGANGAGSFYVEDYKKPEYQVTVKSPVQHLLQGNPIQANIQARYFFGEPVAGAKVTYVVHTSTHYWSDSDNEDAADSASEDSSDDSDDTWGQTEQQEHTGVLDANGQLSVMLPTRVDGKQNDQDYRIEARVTDTANREVSGHTTVLATYGSFRVSAEPASYVYEAGQPVKIKITAQDYDGKPVQTAVHLVAAQVNWDSVTHAQNKKQVAAADASTGADGTALVELPMSAAGSGDFEVTASAQTPENRTYMALPGCGSGTAQAPGTSPTRRRRLWRTRRATRWATRRICCS